MHIPRIVAAAIALLIASPTLAADLATMEVAGIRLGASAQQVKTALGHAGYRITETHTDRSFEQHVASEVATRTGRDQAFPTDAGTGQIIAMGPHQERAQVDFAQTAAGSSVSRILVTIPGTAMTAAAFREQLFARYGKPDAVREQGLTLSWCSPQALRICGLTYTAGDLDTVWPKLSADLAYGDSTITLAIGSEADHRNAQAFEAEVVRRVPKTDRAAF
jgi:hypothetical protein